MKKLIFFGVRSSLYACGIFLSLTIASVCRGQIPSPIIAPGIRIISPANHQVFHEPVNVPIFAYVADLARSTNVEFYANGIDLGRGVSLDTSLRPPGTMSPIFGGPPVMRLGAVYCYYWTNIPAGNYALTAVVNHTNTLVPYGSLSRTSAPVNITVLAVTNVTTGPRVVSIVAVDPIAVVGTNKWVWMGETNALPVWGNWPPRVPLWCTNWGPKDALFMVRLSGDTSEVFTASYNIGGTASNGVDYAMLPGAVTFPAGQSDVLIPIVPIDNGPPYLAKSVILTLVPDTNSPVPVYSLGKPSRAEALIVHLWPRPLPYLVGDGTFHLNAAGPDGAWFCVQRSTDLVSWTCIETNQVFDGAIDFVDPDATTHASGYYRAVPISQ